MLYLQNRTSLLWCFAGVLFACYTYSCQSKSKNQAPRSLELELNDEETYDGESSLTSTHKTKDQTQRGRLAHPEKTDAWSTRRSIMLHKQPPAQQILDCKENVESLALPTNNPRVLDDAALQLAEKVSGAFKVYHWCFYQLMTDLDLRLERDDSLLTEKSEAFLSRMKTLWVLARSLDRENGISQNRYANYLRSRYIEISSSYFGRPLEVLDPQLLLPRADTPGKPAEPFAGP